ncbi:MAG: hypothetical protein RMM53_12900 [Bacteroidia bacterium]|nr:hypothetical protein [Bacteroidia bacterium]MDW8335105.1 hypothetical protein [Bacteroidia bacterium]
MDVLRELLEIAKYTIPALLSIGAGRMVFAAAQRAADRKAERERRFHAYSVVLPLTLQAYERMTLYVERIHPFQILTRMPNAAAWTARQLRDAMVQDLRLEYEHNIVQQLYVSERAWGALMEAREEVVAFLTDLARNMPEEATAADYVEAIVASLKKTPESEPARDKALRTFRNEVLRLFLPGD